MQHTRQINRRHRRHDNRERRLDVAIRAGSRRDDLDEEPYSRVAACIEGDPTPQSARAALLRMIGAPTPLGLRAASDEYAPRA